MAQNLIKKKRKSESWEQNFNKSSWKGKGQPYLPPLHRYLLSTQPSIILHLCFLQSSSKTHPNYLVSHILCLESILCQKHLDPHLILVHVRINNLSIHLCLSQNRNHLSIPNFLLNQHQLRPKINHQCNNIVHR